MLTVNRNTFENEIKSNKEVNFNKPNGIGYLLEFKEKKLSTKRHYTAYSITITKVNFICIKFNLIQNSTITLLYIYMFYPSVPPGYKIIENSTNVNNLPINSPH